MVHPDPIIKFSCKCGRRFAVPADRAAGTIQCPDCGLLCDIPTLSDLENLASDGTLRLRPADQRDEPDRLATLAHAFGRDHEKDLRFTLDDIAEADFGEVPLKPPDAAPPRAAPKYDPETGELVRPIEIATGPPGAEVPVDPAAIPVARRAIDYAAGEHAVGMNAGRVLLLLFMPTNIVVMLFILVMHVIVQMSIFSMLGGLFLFAPAVLVLMIVILAHYANVIDETGPEGRDELPRPIRGLSLGDDLWHPFCHFAGALMLCYVPAYLAGRHLPGALGVATGWALAGLGTVAFPAVLLTLATSGTVLNLRPDRVLAVISATGARYVVSVFLWAASLVLYGGSWVGTLLFIQRIATTSGVSGTVQGVSGTAPPAPTPAPFFSHGGVLYPILMAGIIVVHYFCWHLGLIYRDKHDGYPWVLQRHVSERKQAEAEKAAMIRAMRRKPRYVTPADAPKSAPPARPHRPNQ